MRLCLELNQNSISAAIGTYVLVTAGRSYLDRYTDIEAAPNSLILYIDNIGLSIAEPQVVLNNRLNNFLYRKVKRPFENCCRILGLRR